MALNVTLYPGHESMYREYVNNNYGNILFKNPGIFTLPSWLYSYGIYKTKIRFKGIQKIAMVISEYEDKVLIAPGKVLGAIIQYNCQLDFEKLKSIDSLKEQQLFVLIRMHEGVIQIADMYNCEKEGLNLVFQQTYQQIKNDSIPDAFWDVRI